MSQPPGRLTPSQRNSLAIALTAVAGSVDAIGYILLYRVFTANMTGNTVAIGMGVVQGDWSLAVRRGFIIPMFLIGMLWSRVIAHLGYRRHWRHSASVLFGSEALLLACFAVAGLLLLPDGRIERSTGSIYFLLVALPALAMGVQNASLSHFGPLSVRTTHVTGNLATLADQMAIFGIWFFGAGRERGGRRALADSCKQDSLHETAFLTAVWLAYLTGAAIGAALLAYWHAGAVLPGVCALIGLMIVDWRNPVLGARERRKREPSDGRGRPLERQEEKNHAKR